MKRIIKLNESVDFSILNDILFEIYKFSEGYTDWNKLISDVESEFDVRLSKGQVAALIHCHKIENVLELEDGDFEEIKPEYKYVQVLENRTLLIKNKIMFN